LKLHAACKKSRGVIVPTLRRPLTHWLGHLRLHWLRRALAVTLWALGALGALFALPLTRPMTARILSRAVETLASPFAPGTGRFEALPATTRVLATDGSTIAELNGTQRRDLVHLHQLPPHVAHAVLAAEDAGFYSHSGIDPAALIRAVVRDVQGDHLQGGSTITQQLAKLNYTGSRHTILRKLREVLYASELERTHSKDELLERYLNQVYFGEGAYGVTAAARTFFGVEPDKLSPAQAATLAGKIRAPERLDPRSDPAAVLVRRDQVLGLMHRHRWLTGAQLDQARAERLDIAPEKPAPPTVAPHFVELVKREAATLDALGSTPKERASQLNTGGYTIDTTLDRTAFDASTDAVRSFLGGPKDPTTAVVSVQPGDGAIRNLFGGLDFRRNAFDVASQGRRQPGSAFKPFAYLAMLHDGADPRSVLAAPRHISVPCKGAPYSVTNFRDEVFPAGQATVDEALAHSINTVFAQVVAKVGPESTLKAAESVGIPRGIRPVCAVALGGLDKGLSPLQMAAAYAAIAAKGTYAEPYAVTRIRDRDGHVVYSHETQSQQTVDQKEAGVLTQALLGVVDHGTGTAAAIGRPMAGKTGTTENFGDAWFVGFVPQLATAVWVGHPEGNVPMTGVHGIDVAGGTFPAQIFSRMMRKAVGGAHVEPLYTVSPDELSLRPFRVVFADQGTLPVPNLTLPPGLTTTTTSRLPATTTTSADGSPPPSEPPSTQPVPSSTTPTSRPPPTTTATTRPPPSTTTTR
jgi:penicillin-binding protein 1A